MATEKVIKVTANTESAVKDVEKLKDTTKDLGSTAEKSSEKATKGTKDIGKAAQKSEKSVKNVGKGFKILGGAMKAAGIGLVVALVAKLTQAFSQNQKVVDTVSGIFETINIVFTQFTNVLINAFEKVSEGTNGFEAMTAVVKGLMTIALTPLKLLFDGIKLTVQSAQLAWEQSFFGDGDPKTIKELRKGIDETKESIAKTGKEAIKAGADVAVNYGAAIAEVGAFVKETSDNISKISVSAAKASADRIIQLRNEAKLAESQLSGLTLERQKQAEQLRQERDDVRNSIDDRIKANEELGEVLRKQAQDELALAQKKVNLAKEELSQNKDNIDAQVAFQEALNGVADVQERITGQQSEQRTNEAALQDERKASLAELRKIGKSELELAKEESKQLLEQRKQQIERTVSDKKEQDRLIEEAERQHKEKLIQIDAEDRLKKQEKRLEQLEIDKEFDLLQFEEKRQRLKERAELIANDEVLTEEQKSKKLKEIAAKEDAVNKNQKNQEQKREEALANYKVQTAFNVLNSLQSIAEQGSAGAKAIAVAQAILSTYQGINKALAETTDFTPTQTLRFANAAAVGIAGIVNVKKILSTNPKKTGAPSRPALPSRGASQSKAAESKRARAPEFNVVGDSGTNQIADVLGRQTNKPQRAYVVSGEVSSQQELDRSIEAGASLG